MASVLPFLHQVAQDPSYYLRAQPLNVLGRIISSRCLSCHSKTSCMNIKVFECAPWPRRREELAYPLRLSFHSHPPRGSAHRHGVNRRGTCFPALSPDVPLARAQQHLGAQSEQNACRRDSCRNSVCICPRRCIVCRRSLFEGIRWLAEDRWS